MLSFVNGDAPIELVNNVQQLVFSQLDRRCVIVMPVNGHLLQSAIIPAAIIPLGNGSGGFPDIVWPGCAVPEAGVPGKQ